MPWEGVVRRSQLLRRSKHDTAPAAKATRLQDHYQAKRLYLSYLLANIRRSFRTLPELDTDNKHE